MLQTTWTFIVNHWATISTALFFLSEALAQIPQVKSNSVFQLVFGWLSKNQDQPKT